MSLHYIVHGLYNFILGTLCLVTSSESNHNTPYQVLNEHTFYSSSAPDCELYMSFSSNKKEFNLSTRKPNIKKSEDKISKVENQKFEPSITLIEGLNYTTDSTGLIINELMASNDTTASDETGEALDWIEILNQSNTDIDLNGYYFTDRATELTKYKINQTLIIPQNQKLILWANSQPELGVNYLGFSLSADGEFVAIVAPDGVSVIDSVSFPKQKTDVSYGRLTDGDSLWRYFSPASFGSANNPAHAYLGFLEPPTFSQQGGFYQSNISLTIQSTDTIIYSIDGSTPSASNIGGKSFTYRNTLGGPFFSDQVNSYLYQNNAINITDRSSAPNKTSMRATTYLFPYEPRYNLIKSTVVKAVALRENYLPSPVIAETFFVLPPQKSYSLPVVSFSTGEDKLFDYNEGIYTPGVLAQPSIGDCTPGNYNTSWEHEGYFEYYTNYQKVINQPVYFRINGRCSRAAARKSLRLYSTKGDFEKPIFENSNEVFKRIILRNSGNDGNGTLFRDAVFHRISKGLHFDLQDPQPANVFINGEYWGIHNIRPRVDSRYLETLHGVSKDSVDLISFDPNIMEVNEGDDVAYKQLRDFLKNNSDFSNPYLYDSLMKMIDVESFIDYHAAEIFGANWDWIPFGNNNVRLWRYKANQADSNVGFRDGRWRWILADMDLGMLPDRINYNLLDLATDVDNPYSTLFVRLISNPNFRRQFINRFADLLNTHFSSPYTLEKVEEYRGQLLPEIQEHIDRWRRPSDQGYWRTYITELRSFFQQRVAVQRDHIKGKFGIQGEFNLNLNVSDTAAGYVQVNSTALKLGNPGVMSYPWHGIYFDQVPIQIKAKANFGYKFSHWEYNNTVILDSIVTINTSSDKKYKAIFEEDFTSPNPQPVAFLTNKCGYSFTEWNANNTTGSFPNHLAFVYMNTEDPGISANIEGFTEGAYNHSSRTRINGLGENGISFINTGSSRPGYPAARLGGAILGLNTEQYDSLTLSFKAGTQTANSREYALKLQYRIGDKLPFKDFLDQNGQAVVYHRSIQNGHEQSFELKIPENLLHRPYVQFLWRYYYTGIQNDLNSGARDELRLDEIKIRAQLNLQTAVTNSIIHDQYSYIKAAAPLESQQNLQLIAGKSIELLPGFVTKTQSVFKAEIGGCF